MSIRQLSPSFFPPAHVTHISYDILPWSMSIRELSSPISSSGVEVDPRNHGLHVHHDSANLPEAYNEGDKHKVDSSPGQAHAETTLQLRQVILRLRVILALGWTLAIVAIAIASTLAAKRLHELHHLYA